MKKLIVIMTVILAVLVFSGCSSSNPSVNGWYSHGTQVMEVRAEKSNTVYLGIFGESPNYPLVEEIAMENGITRIALIERYQKIGFLGLWIEYTTVVVGERGGAITDLTPEPEAVD